MLLFLLPKCMTIHFLTLYSICHSFALSPNLSKSFCSLSTSSKPSAPPPIFISSANLATKPSIPTSKSLTYNVKGSGPNTDPCGIPLLTSNQTEKAPFIPTFCLLQINLCSIHASIFLAMSWALNLLNSLICGIFSFFACACVRASLYVCVCGCMHVCLCLCVCVSVRASVMMSFFMAFTRRGARKRERETDPVARHTSHKHFRSIFPLFYEVELRSRHSTRHGWKAYSGRTQPVLNPGTSAPSSGADVVAVWHLLKGLLKIQVLPSNHFHILASSPFFSCPDKESQPKKLTVYMLPGLLSSSSILCALLKISSIC
ncbi:uncharacterized protein LOC134359387 [Mobula hypostoma]|uniref:uncharacterized protein LOC134359387 n=1 Tax=Mobula hypostoma TaxID=723540 RepID=UPI002FC2AC76